MITAILKEYVRKTLTEGKGEPLIRKSIRQVAISQINELVEKAEYKSYGRAIKDIKAIGIKQVEDDWKIAGLGRVK